MAASAHCRVDREFPPLFHGFYVSTKVSQLISVISMLSSDPPNIDSPANVDAAKQVRDDLAGLCFLYNSFLPLSHLRFSGYRKKVRRLARKSAEEAFE